MRRIFFLLSLSILSLSAFAQSTPDSSSLHPTYYAYAEVLGPGRFFSLNIERLAFTTHHQERGWYGRFGFEWLPDLSARYTMTVLGGMQLESGSKNWSRNFGVGATFWMDRYNWKKTGELSTHCSGTNCDPTLRWGPYLSLGARYRFDNEVFCGFEFTPMALTGSDGMQLIPWVGASVGFILHKK